jgi:hypothetical protein
VKSALLFEQNSPKGILRPSESGSFFETCTLQNP